MSATAPPPKSTFVIRKAAVSRVHVRAGLVGPPGCGKTYSGLLFARGLAGPNGRIVVIDTENERAANYAATIGFDYDVLPLGPPHSPERYREALLYAYEQGYQVAILDSLSHEWAGEGGTLQQVDAKKDQGEKNSFFAWREPSKAHAAVIGAIVGAPIDVIATIRTKIAYEIQDVGGKKVPKRIGLAPVQREGVEYEFDLVLGIDQESHEATIQKCNAGYHSVVLESLARSPQVSKDLGAKIAAWRAGLPAPPPVETPPPAPPATTTAATATVKVTTPNGAPGTVNGTVTPTPAAATATPPPAGDPPAGEKPKRTRAKPTPKATTPPPADAPPAEKREAPFESYALTGTKCAACGEVQRKTPAGPRCLHGHDALPVTPSGNGAAASGTATSASGAGSPATPSSTTGTPTPSGTTPASPPTSTPRPVTSESLNLDDSVYDIAGVPLALVAEIKAASTATSTPIGKPLFRSVHAWLVAALGTGNAEADKAAAVQQWALVGVAAGTLPTGFQVATLVFNVASIKMTTTTPTTKKES